MTAPLRDLLGELADHEARTSALAAPDVRTEALHMRTQIRRLRTRRIAAVSVGAAAVLAIGIVTANAFTAPPALLPVAPDPSVTSSPAPAPSPSEPSMSPSPTSVVETPPVTPPVTPPQQADVSHGGEVWGTYVAVVDSFDSPEADAAEARITELGYTPSGGSVGCDAGAAEALGLPQDVMVVASYFTTEEDAALFAQMYGPDALGIANVTLFCLD
ncbi:hypothetical protein [Cellulomonas sp. P5_C5]